MFSALKRSRPLVWLLLALPALWIGLRWAITPDEYGYGHAIADSGDWAAWLLMATLAVTPLRLVFKRSGLTLWLMRRRREIGVASFGYAALHTAIYLVRKGSPEYVLAEFTTPYMLAGWA